MRRGWVARTPFHYTESQGDDCSSLAGVSRLHIVEQDGALRMTLKQVDLINATPRCRRSSCFRDRRSATAVAARSPTRFARTAARCADARLAAGVARDGRSSLRHRGPARWTYARSRRRGRAAARRLRARRATATATASGCCSTTGRSSCSTGSRSTRSACRSCRSTPSCARPSSTTSSATARSSLAVSLPSAQHDLRAAAAAAGRRARSRDGSDAATRSQPAAPPPAPRAGPVGTDTECALLYTSGTTGRPKGCVPDERLFPARRPWYAELGGMCGVRPDAERMHHAAAADPHERDGVLDDGACCSTGGCLVQLDRFHPQTLVAERAREPRDDRALPRRDAGDAARAPRHRRTTARTTCASASAPASIRGITRAFEERFGFPLIEAWAMTETGAGARASSPTASRATSARACFGAPRTIVECRVVDDDGRDVAAGCARRAAGAPCRRRDPRRGFFPGYLKDDAATDEAWAGGWFHTGDLVRRDAAGHFHFVDRKKNVIRRSGENISAVEVESVLDQHPAVAGVGGRGGARRGARRRGARVHRAARGRRLPTRASARGEHRRACARAARLLQGAGLRRLRRRAAAHRRRRRSSAAPAQASWRAELLGAQAHCIDTARTEAAGTAA